MKKLFISLLVIALIFTISGCGTYDGYNPTRTGYQQAESILRCFDEEDSESLKAMFCERVASYHDLDQEIKAAMELFDGQTISHRRIQVGGGEAYDDGELTDGHIWYSIWEIKTDADRNYSIATHSYLVYKRSPRCIGITYLTLVDDDTGEKVKIGEYVY